MGPTRREAKHMHWHHYRHPQANPWPAAKTENELGHLALSLRLFFPPPHPPRPPSVLSSSAQSGAGLSLFTARPNISSSYSPHSLTHPPSPPPPAPLHFRNGRGNTSGRRTHAPRRLPRGGRHRLQTTIWRHVSTTTPVNCHLEKKNHARLLRPFQPGSHFHELSSAGEFPGMRFSLGSFFCMGSTWNSRETRR